MALIACPECSRKVSTRAEVCPQCGCPLTVGPDVVAGRRVQTVEQTAKTFKAWRLAGNIIAVVGTLILLMGCTVMRESGETAGVWLGVSIIGIGVLTDVAARVVAWWHHG